MCGKSHGGLKWNVYHNNRDEYSTSELVIQSSSVHELEKIVKVFSTHIIGEECNISEIYYGKNNLMYYVIPKNLKVYILNDEKRGKAKIYGRPDHTTITKSILEC